MATNSNTSAQTLAAYVPAFVAQQLAADPTSISVPSVQRAEGVCLFVDSAGFTPLTEEPARVGTVGAEKMAGVLNETFRPMLSTCAARGKGRRLRR